MIMNFGLKGSKADHENTKLKKHEILFSNSNFMF
jgi:hypothetical protein